MNVKGKTVVVTGVLAGLKRDEAEAGLEALGVEVLTEEQVRKALKGGARPRR